MARTLEALLMATILSSSTCGIVSPSVGQLSPVFGPIVDNEVISGRADDEAGRVLLMVGGNAVVTIDLDEHGAQRVPIQIPEARCWGLARLADGSLWTLKNRRAVVMIDSSGRAQREIALDAPHLAVFGDGKRLVYQEANLDPPGPVLRAAEPGDPAREPWSDLRLRTFAGLNHATVAVLNLVICGVGYRGETPCWFADETAVSLVDRTGHTRRVELGGLHRVAPETLVAAENPMRPVRDAYVDASGTIWILSSGAPPEHAPDLPGGWVLARYGSHGEIIDRRRLPEPVRLILRAGGGRALLLTGAGMVAEVRP